MLKNYPLCEIKTLEFLRMQISSISGRRFCISIVYRTPRGTKLSGTETEFYSDLDILFTDASYILQQYFRSCYNTSA